MPHQLLIQTQGLDRRLGGMEENVDLDQAWQNVAVSIHIRYQARIIVCECPASQEAWQAGDIRDCKLDRGYAGGENRRWGR